MKCLSFEPEGATEIARRLFQERLVTWALGGIFPERTTLADIHRILEVGCGPGSWCLDVARSYPDCWVMGVDWSPAMMSYARALKDLHGLQNVHFKQMNSDGRLPLEPQSVDLMTLHGGIGSLSSPDWPQLLQEGVRVVRPKGTIRVVDEDLLGQTNGNAHRQFSFLCQQLLQPDEGMEERIPLVQALLQNGGCEHLHQQAYSLDVSFGTEAHQGYVQSLDLLLRRLLPLFRHFVATHDDLDQLLCQVLDEVRQETFQGYCTQVVRWGERGHHRV